MTKADIVTETAKTTGIDKTSVLSIPDRPGNTQHILLHKYKELLKIG